MASGMSEISLDETATNRPDKSEPVVIKNLQYQFSTSNEDREGRDQAGRVQEVVTDDSERLSAGAMAPAFVLRDIQRRSCGRSSAMIPGSTRRPPG
jgi:hypothetical protein